MYSLTIYTETNCHRSRLIIWATLLTNSLQTTVDEALNLDQ